MESYPKWIRFHMCIILKNFYKRSLLMTNQNSITLNGIIDFIQNNSDKNIKIDLIENDIKNNVEEGIIDINIIT